MRQAIVNIYEDHVNVVYEETGKETEKVTFLEGDQIRDHIVSLCKNNWNIKSYYHNNQSNQ